MQILKGIGVYLEVAKFDHFFGIEKKRNIYCIVNMQKNNGIKNFYMRKKRVRKSYEYSTRL